MIEFSFNAFLIAAVTGVLLAIVAVILYCRSTQGPARAALLLLALVCVMPAAYLFCILHPELFDARFRAYKGFYRDIRVGMTRDDVLAALERRYPPGGQRQKPKMWQDDSQTLNFFMNPEHSNEPNCEGIFLSMNHGRVAAKHYSPD